MIHPGLVAASAFSVPREVVDMLSAALQMRLAGTRLVRHLPCCALLPAGRRHQRRAERTLHALGTDRTFSFTEHPSITVGHNRQSARGHFPESPEETAYSSRGRDLFVALHQNSKELFQASVPWMGHRKAARHVERGPGQAKRHLPAQPEAGLVKSGPRST